MTQQSKCSNGKREVSLVNNRMKSSELFERCKELTIIHNKEEYKLRLTANGKLILTK